ncbi:MAG: hypothetical protein CYPHOPRED_004373, partial [Cyphobasidiales sp. Tagirdzhanova-0007]
MSTMRKFLDSLKVKEQKDDDIPTSTWINRDIQPLPPSRRTWGPWSFVGFWMMNGFNISGWATASSLLALGLNVWQSFLAIIIGEIIYGTQLWFGAECVKVFIGSLAPGFLTMRNTLPASAAMETNDLICVIIFSLISLPLIWFPPETYRKPFMFASVTISITCTAMLIVCLAKAGGG